MLLVILLPAFFIGKGLKALALSGALVKFELSNLDAHPVQVFALGEDVRKITVSLALYLDAGIVQAGFFENVGGFHLHKTILTADQLFGAGPVVGLFVIPAGLGDGTRVLGHFDDRVEEDFFTGLYRNLLAAGQIVSHAAGVCILRNTGLYHRLHAAPLFGAVGKADLAVF